jgi:hypothetical protein
MLGKYSLNQPKERISLGLSLRFNGKQHACGVHRNSHACALTSKSGSFFQSSNEYHMSTKRPADGWEQHRAANKHAGVCAEKTDTGLNRETGMCCVCTFDSVPCPALLLARTFAVQRPSFLGKAPQLANWHRKRPRNGAFFFHPATLLIISVLVVEVIWFLMFGQFRKEIPYKLNNQASM